MYISFDEMADNARVWIFQSNTHLEFEKVERASARLMNFLDKWQAHGNDLKASFNIMYNRFIIVALDEASYQATGCSIDSLTHAIQDIEKELDIDLLDRLLLCFRDDENNMINHLNLNDFRQSVKENEIGADTVVFNNLIKHKSEIDTLWEVPLKDSWHKQFLN